MTHLTYEELYDYITAEDYDLQERCEEHLMECGQCMCRLQRLTEASRELPMLGTALEALNHKAELTAAYQYQKTLSGQLKPSLKERILNLVTSQRDTFQVLMKSDRFQGISGILLDSLNELTPFGRLKPELLTATRGNQGRKIQVASVIRSEDYDQTYVNVDGQNQRLMLSLACGDQAQQAPVGILISADWQQDAIMKEAEWNQETKGYEIKFDHLDHGEYQFFLL